MASDANGALKLSSSTSAVCLFCTKAGHECGLLMSSMGQPMGKLMGIATHRCDIL